MTITGYLKLKAWDKIVEFWYGQSIKSTIIENPNKEWNILTWKWQTEDWKIIDYLINFSHLQYAPDIYLTK